MTIQEILSEFDIEGKHFDYFDYASKYSSCNDAEKSSVAYQAEVMASELTEDYIMMLLMANSILVRIWFFKTTIQENS